MKKIVYVTFHANGEEVGNGPLTLEALSAILDKIESGARMIQLDGGIAPYMVRTRYVPTANLMIDVQEPASC